MFNPNEHMIQLKDKKGNKKDYLQVAWRLVWFRDEKPEWAIDTQALTIDEEHAIFKTTIYDENGCQKSAGHGSESKKDFWDFIEKAETKSIGRALAMLGYGTQFAGNELDEGERIVDSPIDRTNKAGTDAPADKAAENDEDISNISLPKPGAWNPLSAVSSWAKDHGMDMEKFVSIRAGLVKAGTVEDIPCRNLTPEQAALLFAAINDSQAEK